MLFRSKALTVRRGYEFNTKLKAMPVSQHIGASPVEKSFAGVNAENVVLTAVKKTEDGSALLFRFYEWAGTTSEVQLTVPAGATSATLTNLMEQPEGSPLAVTRDSKITVSIHPYEIVSVRVDYPSTTASAQAK